MIAAKEMNDLKLILERKYTVIPGAQASAFNQNGEIYTVIEAIKIIQFPHPSTSDVAELIVEAKERFNDYAQAQAVKCGQPTPYLYWRREPTIIVEPNMQEKLVTNGEVEIVPSGDYSCRLYMRVLLSNMPAEPAVKQYPVNTEQQVNTKADFPVPTEPVTERKFTPQFEQYVRAGMEHFHGPANRDELRRETIEYQLDGRLKVTYQWKGGHQDFVFVPPPGWELQKFTPEYENHMRVMTNPDGQGNSAIDPEKFKQMPPQDKIVRESLNDMPCGGIASEIRWQSGRQDVLILPKAIKETEEQKGS